MSSTTIHHSCFTYKTTPLTVVFNNRFIEAFNYPYFPINIHIRSIVRQSQSGREKQYQIK